MNKIRFKFIRGEEVKYISHLDLMKVFDRATRRSRIPIAYSQGFNPHPQFVFGLPLSVGVTSEAEYADFELTEPVDLAEFTRRLNNDLPEGLEIVEAKNKDTKENIMSAVSAASYILLLYSESGFESISIVDRIHQLMNMPDIIVKKESKKKVRDVDIKPMIYHLQAEFFSPGVDFANQWIEQYAKELTRRDAHGTNYDIGKMFCLSMKVKAGSAANLKPELLFAAFNEVSESDIKLLKIHRTGLFVTKEGNLAEPLDAAVLSGK